MKHLKNLLALTVVLVAFGCSSSRWYKGNIHTHSLWSDGDDFPEMITGWYYDHGYHFLALSDHNILSRGEKWMALKQVEKRGGSEALAKYVRRFGEDWVKLRGEGDSREVCLRPLAEFRGLFEKEEHFLMVEGEEITDLFAKKIPVHLNATNLVEFIPPQGGNSVRDMIRRNIRAVEKQAEETGQRILGHLNHPNFHYAITAEDIAHVVEERFFEVYNGHPSVHHLGDENHPGVERLWDIANTIRLAELKAPPLFAVATDDSHNYHGVDGATPGRGWIMVQSGELSADSLIEAMEAGDFYASSGVSLESVTFDADRGELTVTIDPADDVKYTTYFIGTLEGYDSRSEAAKDKDGKELENTTRRYSDQVGAVLRVQSGNQATYKLTGMELYVRAMVQSNRAAANPVFEGQLEQAWTQPVGWRKRVDNEQQGSHPTD